MLSTKSQYEINQIVANISSQIKKNIQSNKDQKVFVYKFEDNKIAEITEPKK